MVCAELKRVAARFRFLIYYHGAFGRHVKQARKVTVSKRQAELANALLVKVTS